MGFEYLKHSDETKLQMSISRKKWIKENKDKFNWNIRKGKSEPCELFKSYLIYNNISFISEYSPFEERFFSIDIALPDKMVAIEINGNQHYDKNGELATYYQERHNFIESKGWKIYEVHFSLVYKNLENIVSNIIDNATLIDNFDYQKWIANPNLKKYITDKLKYEKLSIKNERLDKLKQEILSSKINFDKFGWVEQVSKIIGITPQKVGKWMERNMSEFYKMCYRKKQNGSMM